MLCTICERRCSLAPGKSGACGLYEEDAGAVRERYPDRYLVTCPISIETMPVLHFFPGGKFLQVSTTGCNFNCPGCISTVIVREMDPQSMALRQLPPERVVEMAEENGCLGIVFLMNDPLASLPTFQRVATEAKSKGLRVGCATNGYSTQESLASVIQTLDFVSIGIKGMTDQAYRACDAPDAAPVLRNMRTLVDHGVHVEAACILRRDNQEELRQLARAVAAQSPEIPLLVMRFIPLEGEDIALEPTIRDAEAFCASLRATVPHVYLFNSPGTKRLNTLCPDCGHLAYERDFYGPMGAKLRTASNDFPPGNRCARCGHAFPIKGCPCGSIYQEGDFEGGYPFTRALEMVEAMLIAIGVKSRSELVRAWEAVLCEGMKRLHRDLQHPRGYTGLMRYFGELTGRSERAEKLAIYLERRLRRVEDAVAGVTDRPRVFYAMGKPLFGINGCRMENELVTIAGGLSVNRELPDNGRPGRTLDVETLRSLQPDHIFVSAFISCSLEDFMAESLELGLNVRAVNMRRIHTFPTPGWDFGSPRWILGLMHIANTLHPERCDFDVMAEADSLYRCFYGMPFVPEQVNRSFGKPARTWRWLPEIPGAAGCDGNPPREPYGRPVQPAPGP